jgi:hypothetical protein
VTDPDPFDEIVRNLDLEIDFPEEPAPAPAPQPVHPSVASTVDDDDKFYRRVEPRPVIPRSPHVLFAWLGVIGSPICIMVTSLMNLIMPRPILLGCGLVFVAAAIYLIAQLPERGPGEPHWPDDGAQL